MIRPFFCPGVRGGRATLTKRHSEVGEADHPAVSCSVGFGFDEQIRQEIGPAVRELGYHLVELDAARLRHSSFVKLVVYRHGPFGVDDCATIARAVRYRLALVPGAEDAHLEVTSPGTTRKLKSPNEYAIFAGKLVEVLLDDQTEWVRGVIVDAEDGILRMECADGVHTIELSLVRKGRLIDEMSEGNTDV